MFRFNSMMSRVIFLHVLAIVVAAIVMPLVLYWQLSAAVERLQREAMVEQAETLANSLSINADGTLALNLSAALRHQYSQQYGRYFYVVMDEAGSVLFSSRHGDMQLFRVPDSSTAGKLTKSRSDGGAVSGISIRKQVGKQRVWIQVAEDLAHRDVLIDDVITNFIPHVAWLTLPVLILLLASDIGIFRLVMRPVLLASNEAAHITPDRINARLPVAGIPGEIMPLVIAVNQAFDRLEEGYRKQKEFTADAAHELRTPLAVLRTRIELLPDQPGIAALRHDVEMVSRVIGQLLDANELETLVIGESDAADLQLISTEVVQMIAPLALSSNKNIELTGTRDPVMVRGNAEMIHRAVRNLVENALRHTRPDTSVEISVEAGGKVSILDDGEGVPAATRDTIFKRYWRRDRETGNGAGLGLSIVKKIVAVHGGTIAVENRPTGGAIFSMTFPLAPPR